MPCYKPLVGYYSRRVNKSGKRSLVFNADRSLLPVKQLVSCGRCIGCRLDRSLSWALRCVHEASLYEDNSFITLTFDEDHVGSGSLKVSDFQKFMKRLRKRIYPKKVRFFHCGEYGSKFSRPHHHACLFGYDFPDKELQGSRAGNKVYTSAILQSLWPFGFSTIGSVTFESAAYVARYVLKKWSKEDIDEDVLYSSMKAMSDQDFKKLHYGDKKPEYITMSRRPGIGQGWFNNFKLDVYPHGYCVVNGKKVKPPKYYEDQFSIDKPFGSAMLKTTRIKAALSSSENVPRRLHDRELFKKYVTTKQLTRSFENDNVSV